MCKILSFDALFLTQLTARSGGAQDYLASLFKMKILIVLVTSHEVRQYCGQSRI